MARLAWFTPLPPTRSGIADYSAALLPRLARPHDIEVFTAGEGSVQGDSPVVRPAHEFVWRQAQRPYDLVVYQLGNSTCHDFMWPHLARYPGLVVLHDGQLHHARSARLLTTGRQDEYRAEFLYNHPDAPPGVAELVIDALAGSLYYVYPMLRWVLRTARLVAVHSPGLAADLREEHPGVEVSVVRHGMEDPSGAQTDENALLVRRKHGVPADVVLFAAFGLLTPEKRIPAALRAFAALRGNAAGASGSEPHLMLAGGTVDYYDPVAEARALGIADRVHITGYVPNEELAAHVAAADVCLSLRWPSGRETSGAWLRALAAGKPTVLTDLAHSSEAATLDPRTGAVLPATRPWPERRVDPSPGQAPGAASGSRDPVSVSIDLVEEAELLLMAMKRLSTDAPLRAALGRAARAHWAAQHTMEAAVEDCERAIARAIERPVPRVRDLPAHLMPDPLEAARRTVVEWGVEVDFLSS